MADDKVLLEMKEQIGRVDEKVIALDKKFDKLESLLEKKFDDHSDKHDKIEDRIGVLESAKNQIWAIAWAGAFVITMIWNVGGDYIKSSIFSPSAVVQVATKEDR